MRLHDAELPIFPYLSGRKTTDNHKTAQANRRRLIAANREWSFVEHVSVEGGVSTAYSLDTIQERGCLFIGPQEEIYEGMIIGENARPDDMPVNPCRAKKLTNMRSQGDGKGISLAPPLKMSLERALEYIAPDEYVEATPKSLRLRKRILDATTRKRAAQKVG